MIHIRRADERGKAEHGWLSSRHTFSFGSYYDPKNMGFSALRVINDDRVAPGRGFGSHSHRDMEILSYVLSGELAHKDSMGNGSVLRPGQIQLMSAGRGVTHSEFNGSSAEPVHFLQIWLLPNRTGEPSDYQETPPPAVPFAPGLRLIVSPEGSDGALRIKQDTRVYAGQLQPEQAGQVALEPGRLGYVHVARGRVRLLGEQLATGDGAAVTEEARLELIADEDSEVLVFDLPPD